MKSGQRVLAISCGVEAMTGLGMLVVPATVVALVLGARLEGAATVIVNIAGLALISLAIACWPRGDARVGGASVALLVYNLLVGLLLAWTGITGTVTSVLLWPVVAVHLILAALIALPMTSSRGGPASQT